MADFAVHIDAIHEEDKGSWVLAVEGDKVLIAHEDDKSLHWYPMADCTLANVHTPNQPTMVMVVTPQSGNGIVRAGTMPPPNRAERRRGA